MSFVIAAQGLRKRFGKTVALDGLDLVAEPGQVVAVLGPNGAGKTTFVRAVATLLRLDGGTLRVAGHDVRRRPGAVRRVIGLAGQSAAVEPAMTGRENLVMVARLYGLDRRAARTAADRLLDQLRLEDAADRLVRTYSGGLRRRLDLGASLAGNPRLLLLDEPTTGLDPRSRLGLWDAIRELVRDGTDVLLTTQYLTAAGVAEDLELGVVDRLRSLPIPRTAFLAGRAVADTAVLVWSLLVAALVSFAIGFRIHGDALDVLLAAVLLVVFGFAFVWLFIALGLFAGSAKGAQGLSFLVFPLTFVSSAYVQAQTLPGVLRPFAEHQPLTMMINAVRGLVQGPAAEALLAHPTSTYVLRSLLWTAAILIVAAPLAVARYRRG